MNVTVSVPGNFPPAYAWARWLEQRDELERIITPLPYARTRAHGVSRERTRSLWPVAGTNYAVQRLAPAAVQGANQWAVSGLFDRMAARAMGQPDVFNGWGSTSLMSIRRVHGAGIPAVLTVASSHSDVQTQILTDEHSLRGIAWTATHPRVIERLRREYDEADLIVAPSAWVVASFTSRGIAAEKMRLVPWGVTPVCAPVDRARRSGDVRILFVGRAELRKGLGYLLEAMHFVRGAELRLSGQPNRDLVQRLGGLPANTTVTGLLRGVPFADEYRRADIFVLPSIEDASPLVISWALAAGLPVVTTDRAGADAVVDGHNGFVVPAGDSGALADRLQQLVDDAPLRRQMGANAAAGAVRSWDDYGRDLYGVIESLARPQVGVQHAAAA
jgi:glycosyltransferase involved in cell wall biosynthesis